MITAFLAGIISGMTVIIIVAALAVAKESRDK